MDLFNFLKKKKVHDFETLLQRAADEPAYRMEFIQRLLSEKLVVITNSNEIREGFRVVEKNTKVGIFSFEDGRIPVFTSIERIFDKGIITQQVKFLELKGEDLFNILKGKTLVLNPYSDYGKEFLPEEIENLLNGTYFDNNVKHIKITKATTVRIGQPSKYPAEIVKSLIKLFSAKSEVNAAYLAWIHDPLTDDDPHYIFAIDTFGDWDNLSKEAGFITKQNLGPDQIVDFMQISNNGGINDYFIKSTTPFYKKVN
jgi:hypothetical protein